MYTFSPPRPPSCLQPTADAPGKRRRKRRPQLYRESIDKVLNMMGTSARTNADMAAEMQCGAQAIAQIRAGIYPNMSQAQVDRAHDIRGTARLRYQQPESRPVAPSDYEEKPLTSATLTKEMATQMHQEASSRRIQDLERDKAIMQTCIEILMQAGVGSPMGIGNPSTR